MRVFKQFLSKFGLSLDESVFTMNTEDKKCIVISRGQTRCLVIDGGNAEKSVYRLPFTHQISVVVLKEYELLPLGQSVVLLLTDGEVSPWDLLEPFPPADYYDFSYMELDFGAKNQLCSQR